MESKNFAKIDEYFKKGLWSVAQVYNVVGLPYGITEDEFELIVGTPYKDEPYEKPILGDTLMKDMTLSVKGTIHSIQAEEEIKEGYGRIEIIAPADLKDEWAVAEICKWELFNGTKRIDAIPCYLFSTKQQTTIVIGLRTSGLTSKQYTKMNCTLLFKRR